MLFRSYLRRNLRKLQTRSIVKTQKPPINKPFTEDQKINKSINEFYNKELSSILANSLKYSNKKTWEITTQTLRDQKYPTRQRVEMILDPDSFFLELSQIAGHEMYGEGRSYKTKSTEGESFQESGKSVENL